MHHACKHFTVGSSSRDCKREGSGCILTASLPFPYASSSDKGCNGLIAVPQYSIWRTLSSLCSSLHVMVKIGFYNSM